MKINLRISSIVIIVCITVIAIYMKGHSDGETGNDNTLPIGQANAESTPVEWSRTQPYPVHM